MITIKDFDDLNCPYCDELCKPTSVSSNFTVSYKHNCASQGIDYTFKILPDGNLKE